MTLLAGPGGNVYNCHVQNEGTVLPFRVLDRTCPHSNSAARHMQASRPVDEKTALPVMAGSASDEFESAKHHGTHRN